MPLITHALLGLWFLYERRTLRMPPWQATQAALGLCIPPLLLGHVMGTRMAYTLFGADGSYTRILLGLWHLAPEVGLRQAVTLLVVWIHGCMGIHFWLRFRPWYPRATPLLFGAALLVPVLALLGFVEGGREVSRLAAQPGWVAETLRAMQRPGAAGTRSPRRPSAHHPERLRGGAGRRPCSPAPGAPSSRAGGRSASPIRAAASCRSRPGSPCSRPAGARASRTPRSAAGEAAARPAAFASCGGYPVFRPPAPRKRACSSAWALPRTCAWPASFARAATSPWSRCSRPCRHPSPSRPLIIGPGQEQEVAVLFADLRGFTRVAEHKLPYDVVFLLNRYFEVVGTAIERAGGIANQFTGDGVMALFGVDAGPDVGARQALTAARALVTDLAGLSQELAHELPAPLRMGIGIHVGHAVVGRMGYGPGVYLTAVGDTVHVASRLEQLTKEYDCELVITEEVARRAGIDTREVPRHELTVRNRRGGLAVYTIARVAMLPAPAGERAGTSS